MASTPFLQDSTGRPYILPVNEERETDRLEVQHRMWRLLAGGLYPASAEDKIGELMAANNPAIMDVGCGSGIWAIEMAEKYPNARVVGVDNAANVNLARPKNFEFVRMDLTVGLPPVDGGYDIIHARCLTGHLKDPAAFVRSVYEFLKPGGLIILGEVYKAADANKQQLTPLFPNVQYSTEALKTGSWLAGWQTLYFKHFYANNQTVASLLEAHGGFSPVQQNRYFAPVGWPGDDNMGHGELGQMSQKTNLEFVRASTPAALASGKFSEAEVDAWVESIEQEIKMKHVYVPWDLSYGIKSAI
ncbi:S-adenosyl-L-methionine-dependent methyltransferase [Mycena epipterygia]|nr:S-adenosyl-L-methionine-dependent methyltransferase [Mycena epipterygia]